MIQLCKSKLTATVSVMLLNLSVLPEFLCSKAWNPNLVDPHVELLAVHWMRVSFDHSQREFRGHQEEERRKVPVYNAHLNGAVVAFHAHISKDNHHLIMNCALCRKYL
jgi:hypothetical protein